jgi:quercetin dioxygenase-like cupin family protein
MYNRHIWSVINCRLSAHCGGHSMKHRRVVSTIAGCLGLSLVLGASHRMFAQQDPSRPTSEVVAKVSLAEVGLPAGAASATRFVYAPGKAMAAHTHTGRTSIITVVQGHLTEHRGDAVHVYGPGDVIAVAEGTTHANENAGPDNLIYVEVNITGTVPGPAATPARGR